MKKTLQERFDESNGKPVLYDGRLVHAVVYRNVTKPGRFIVRFKGAIESPVQALALDIKQGTLVIAGEESARMILRLDTSPDVVEVLYQPPPEGSRIVIYNEWIDEDGRIDAWLMHAGMLVEETENKMILRCSDGRGEPTFDDLIVEIDFLEEQRRLSLVRPGPAIRF